MILVTFDDFQKDPGGPFKGPRGSFKRTSGVLLKDPGGPFQGPPRILLKDPRGTARGTAFRCPGLAGDPQHGPEPLRICLRGLFWPLTSAPPELPPRGRPRKIENGHERALELVSGANFGCVLHHFSGPTHLEGSRGQVRQGIGQKPRKQVLFLRNGLRIGLRG